MAGLIAAALALLAAMVWLARIGAEPDPLPIRSIAVLPLLNLSGDPSETYFADGVTEDLIGALAGISSLRVPSHRSVSRYRGTTEPLPEIAADLSVDALVEGSVRREGERVRITVQLVRGTTDEHLWHDSFDEDAKDILALQARIARSVAERVRATVSDAAIVAAERERSVVPAAYDAYLRARQIDRVEYGWATDAIVDHLERAVELDPEFGIAHAWLANAYFSAAVYNYRSAASVVDAARTHAQRAISLGAVEGDSPLGHIASFHDWNFEEGRERFRRVQRARPGTLYAGWAQLGEGMLLCALGEPEAGLAAMREASRVDPVYLVPRAYVHDYESRTRDFSAALEGALALIAIPPSLGHLGEVVPDGEVLEVAQNRAETLAPGPTLAYGRMKDLPNASFGNSLQHAARARSPRQLTGSGPAPWRP